MVSPHLTPGSPASLSAWGSPFGEEPALSKERGCPFFLWKTNGPRLGRESLGDPALQGSFRRLDQTSLHGTTPWGTSQTTMLVAPTEVMEVATATKDKEN